MYINKVLVLALLFFCNAAALNRVPFDYTFIENELQLKVANYAEFKKISDTPMAYRAWGVWTFKHSISEVAAVALDFEQYSKIFSHVYKCEKIVEPKKRISPLGTWYVEGRAAFARVWSIGNIDTLLWTDSTHLRLIASQNEAFELESAWGRIQHGWMNFRTNGIHFAAFIVAVGPDSCRMGVIAQGLVKEKMPVWLVRLTTNIILKQLMQNLESEVKQRAEAKKERENSLLNRIKNVFLRFLP